MFSHATILFLVFVLLLGILFSIFLIRKKIYCSGYIFLLCYFAVMLLQITFQLITSGWLTEHWQVLYDLSYQLPFLYGPLIYLFTKKQLKKRSFQLTELFHFVPFVMVVFFLIIGHINDESPTALFPFVLVKFRLLLQLTSIYLYHWVALQCWVDNRETNSRFRSVLESQSSWIKRFIYASFVVSLAIALLNYFMVKLYPQLDHIGPVYLVLTLFIYWISYEAVHHRETFHVIKGYATETDSTKDLPLRVIPTSSKRYKKSNLSADERSRASEPLRKLMQKKTL